MRRREREIIEILLTVHTQKSRALKLQTSYESSRHVDAVTLWIMSLTSPESNLGGAALKISGDKGLLRGFFDILRIIALFQYCSMEESSSPSMRNEISRKSGRALGSGAQQSWIRDDTASGRDGGSFGRYGSERLRSFT